MEVKKMSEEKEEKKEEKKEKKGKIYGDPVAEVH